MTWDAAAPLGSANANTIDDVFRTLKADLETALTHEGVFPSATPSTPKFMWKPGYGATASRPTGDGLVTGRIYLNTTLNIIERYSGSAWVSVADNMPATTAMVFYQATAPTGWTAVALSDKFLRVVGSGTTGGTAGLSGIAASADHNHLHTVAVSDNTGNNSADHTHEASYVNKGHDSNFTDGDIVVWATGNPADTEVATAGTKTTSGASASHNHPIAYSGNTGTASVTNHASYDVIVATKN